ncbi:hemolysin family protein [Brevibacillus centrosporus]|jgi:CBS domain containing-hemolysin-like protein|uniref:Hemolysin, contains CBS domains n=1 Tax=Brevibacillus centrosporus TaxID=54910 RepID=A0A1I3SA91_9BACL|nr:hemolysin family protein [Brevibacillus centrosporus]MEC2131885.1 hemolysin family protein [Brevibacillus centrosporus]MED4909309.1 hemolysin family protein [Brevibacillus centrosporus]RNB69429.1 HlyC/CorC family transporter [Brevibacillus centrosporus]SFJ55310.1 Hemolysin, contains CBS domains [Brevibacillus centrosporus]GED33268.1 membrane protein [Brevibacillus centrosporus]
MVGAWFNLVMVVLLVFLNGFFVATEFAVVKVRESRIAQLVAEGNSKAADVEKLLHNLDAYLSACQLGITLASLGLGWLGEPAVAHLLYPVFRYFGLNETLISSISIIIAFSVITFLHIVLGELAPKTMAIQKTEMIVLAVAKPIMWFHKIMYPFIHLLNWSASRFLALFHISMEPHQEAHTEEEIRILVNESHKSGLIDNTEMMLVDNIFDFSETMAREIMVPRTDMVVLNIRDPFEENVRLVQNGRYTRYPVVDGDKDHVVGSLHIKDMLTGLLEGEQRDLESLMRSVLTVPETISISRLLTMLQKQRGQMAIIIDEYGGTAGLVTLEDIMEEIVGDIQDEFDDERPEVERRDNILSLDGRMLLEEVSDYLDIDLESSEVDTLAGWIYMQFDHSPRVGDMVRQGNYQFIVGEVDHYRITRVIVKKLPVEEAVVET